VHSLCTETSGGGRECMDIVPTSSRHFPIERAFTIFQEHNASGEAQVSRKQ
jgi:hypothetical protein